jgi:hypothetical protein
VPLWAMITSQTATSVKPLVQTARVPKRVVSAGAIRRWAPSPGRAERTSTAASSGVSPRTSWRYCIQGKAEEGRELHEDRHAGGGRLPVATEARVKDRCGLAKLPSDEADEQHERERAADDRTGGEPPAGGCLDHRENERDESRHRDGGTGEVQTGSALVGGLGRRSAGCRPVRRLRAAR